jgi:hypothetical protein
MIYNLQERLFNISEFRNMELDDLKQLRIEISDRISWFLTTENYDSKKVAKLTSNEKKINKVIKEMI